MEAEGRVRYAHRNVHWSCLVAIIQRIDTEPEERR
jgi:hypothetical protein